MHHVQIVVFIGTLYVSGVLEEGVNELDNEATKKAKFFYQSCMDLRKYAKLAQNYNIRFIYFVAKQDNLT